MRFAARPPTSGARRCSTSGNTVTVGGRRVTTEVYPIGVDVDAIQREATESLTTETCQAHARRTVGPQAS